ncbi:Nitrosoguanidine resistance protein SNG1 [Psilocybe cubensis]|uniref:DUF3533 domain-containing protein n=2 Tax=Psilocybe cubensis TaxID=181762 RepID=A0A8H7Y7L7_PSICU|nr:Nitrosoguanidine resistance protein SNG1 [Psilocybe cubensis]KAH9485395.1 Nitrosoguanidine resistance protein SNG1 [Psilocybe cubensis]
MSAAEKNDSAASTVADHPPSLAPPVPHITSAVVVPSYLDHFWDQGPEIAKARKIYINILFQRTCLIVGAIFGIFSIYWGALWQLPARSLRGWVVDFDGDQVGQFVTLALSTNTAFSHIIDWRIYPASDFPNGPDDVIAAVLDEKCWVAITINPGATKSLNDTLHGGGPETPTSNAISAYALEARNENAFRTLLRPTVTTLLDEITHGFAVKIMGDIVQNNTSIAAVSPNILTRPIYFTVQNLRPFDVPVATAVTFIGLIYLLILSFIVVNSGILARGVSGMERKLTTASLIRIRIASPILIYFVLSLAYTVLTRAFKLPFDRHFGRAGFVLFWMLSWFGMTAAGLALESMMTLLTIKYIQVFLILWIIGNVSVCLWPIDALPVLYNYGHAAPFYQISRGVRSIVFGTKNELGMNFGILAVWIGISCISLPVLQWYVRRGEVGRARAGQRKA